ncbi:hypothetical protein ACL6C3_17150 [Capilliphycus salinus ALCB114379]|uniref:hypothetical protein n=1 Tax=Capilliphycus salinus TaxID=2768948 RepID=UPI0039A4A80F
MNSEPQSSPVPRPSNESPPPSPPADSSGSYAEKTHRILAWVQVIRSISPLIWLVVILLVIIPLGGQFFIHQAFDSGSVNGKSQPTKTVIVQPSVNWQEVDTAVATALTTAHNQAENYASQQLDLWIDDLMGRVEDNFLSWYFGYFNQKQIEFKSVFVQLSSGVANLLNPDLPSPSEKVAEVITRDFQEEFAKRVLRPQIAQLQLERLTQQTVKQYLQELSGNLNQIPVSYQIPQADWNRYLSDIAISIYDTEGEVSNLSLKVLVGGSAYLAMKPLVAPLVLKVGSKVAANLAGKAGAKIALKTGASLTGKMAAGLLDCTVGVGILLWDIWDTYHTANIEKPILKETIAEYLEQVKASILDNPETGIMAAIDQLEAKIIHALDSTEKISS